MSRSIPAVDDQANSESNWSGVVSIAAGTFVLVTTEFLPIGLLSRISSEFGVSEGVAGLSVTAPGLVAAFAAPLLMLLAGSLDRRTIIVALTAAIVISNALACLAPDFSMFLVARLLLGLAVGGLWSFAVAVGRRLVPESAGARATSLISAGICAGTVFGMPIGAVAGDWIGWRAAFAINAAFGFLILLLQFRCLPRLAAITVITASHLIDFGKLRMARIGLIASGLVAAGHFVAYTFLETYLRQGLDFSGAEVPSALAVFACAGIIGSFLGERLAIRNIRWAFFISAAAVGASVFAASALTAMPVSAMVVLVIWGVAFGAVPVCVQIWMYTSSPALYEAGSALMVSAFQISLAVGSATGGLIVNCAGLGPAFAVSGAISMAGAAVVLILRLNPASPLKSSTTPIECSQ